MRTSPERLDLSEIHNNSRETTQDLYNRWREILERFRNDFWEESSEYQNALREYQELRSSIERAISENNEITRQELAVIRLEQSNLERLNLNSSNNVFLNSASNLVSRFRWETDLNRTFENLRNSIWSNTYQEDLLREIFWEDFDEKWYNDTYLHWYTDETIWNFVISIEDFEKKLESNETRMDNINSKALWNYFKYLIEHNNDNISDTLISKMGASKIIELWELWKKWGDNITTFNLLKTFSSWENLIKIIKTFDSSNSENILDTLSWETNKDNLKIFFEWLRSLTTESNQLWIKMQGDITEKLQTNNPWISDEEALNISIRLINRFNEIAQEENYLINVLGVINEANLEYNLWFSFSDDIFEIILNSRTRLWMQVVELDQRLSNWDISQEEYDEQKILLDARINALNWYIVLVSNTQPGDMESFSQWELTLQELIENSSRWNEELRDFFQETLWNEINRSQINNTKNNTISTNTIDQNIDNNTTFTTINHSSWNIILSSNKFNSTVSLTPREFERVKDSEEKINSILDFNQEIQELKLWFIWDYREFIHSQTFCIDLWDWISDIEKLKVYNFISKQLWFDDSNNLYDITTKFRVLQNERKYVWWDIKEIEDLDISMTSLYWDWVIYNYLNKYWFIDNWIIIPEKWNT